MYKNIIFDIYGTLIDIKTDENSTSFWKDISSLFLVCGASYKPLELKKAYEIKCQEYQRRLERKLKTKDVEIDLYFVFKSLLKDKGVLTQKSKIIQLLKSFREKSIKYICLYDGAKELLVKLKEEKYRLFILSNAQKHFTIDELKKLGIYNYFDGIILSSTKRIKKPNKDFSKAIIDKYNLSIDESIYIGNDMYQDIEGSMTLGLDSIYIKTNLSPVYTGDNKAKFEIINKTILDVEKLIKD